MVTRPGPRRSRPSASSMSRPCTAGRSLALSLGNNTSELSRTLSCFRSHRPGPRLQDQRSVRRCRAPERRCLESGRYQKVASDRRQRQSVRYLPVKIASIDRLRMIGLDQEGDAVGRCSALQVWRASSLRSCRRTARACASSRSCRTWTLVRSAGLRTETQPSEA